MRWSEGTGVSAKKIVEYLHEDTTTAPDAVPLDDDLSVGLKEVIRDNWASIRTHVARGPVQTRFNQRLTTTDMRVLNEPLGEVFDEQTTAFKVNLGYGFILMQKQSGRFKYYHSSCNCCGRYLEEPALISNRADFDSFLERIHESDILQWAITQRPNSGWVCVLVTRGVFRQPHPAAPHRLRRHQPAYLCETQQIRHWVGERLPRCCI